MGTVLRTTCGGLGGRHREHKRGDTFRKHCKVDGPNQKLIDIRGWTIKSQIRTRSDVLIADLQVTMTEPKSGTFDLCSDATHDWPIGPALWDIECSDVGGFTRSSQTIVIVIVKDITL